MKKFKGLENYQHGTAAKVGVLLVNLGTPDEATAPALRRYLGEFLSDHRVIEIPMFIWKVILHGIILRIRPKRSAEAYKRVWNESGSPLMALTRGLAQKVAGKQRAFVMTDFAMRYGNPSVESVMEKMQASGVDRLLVFPLYPQYSGASSGSAADAVCNTLTKWRWVPELRISGAYHDDNNYIALLAEQVKQHWEQNGKSEKLLISFHGMPKRTLELGDPYFCQCHKTARLLAQKLALPDDEWEMAFQSRFGKAEWLQPYLVQRLQALPSEGTKNIDIICPGFAVDCLETLDEIANEGVEIFQEAGGEQCRYIPALNDSEAHADFLFDLINKKMTDWLEEDWEPSQADLAESRNMALNAGAKQ